VLSKKELTINGQILINTNGKLSTKVVKKPWVSWKKNFGELMNFITFENKAEGEPLKKQIKYENIKLANKRFLLAINFKTKML